MHVTSEQNENRSAIYIFFLFNYMFCQYCAPVAVFSSIYSLILEGSLLPLGLEKGNMLGEHKIVTTYKAFYHSKGDF